MKLSSKNVIAIVYSVVFTLMMLLTSNLPSYALDINSTEYTDLTFDQLLEMNKEELQNYSEEFSSIIEDINLAGVYYDCTIYTLNYYDVSRYLDNDGLIQKEKLINDLGLPSELIVYLSDVPDTIIMNEIKCDTVKLELSVEKYKGYSAYNVYRAFELILKTNPDIPFVSVEYSGKANSILSNVEYADLTFNKLLEMNEEELQNYSEEFSSIIEKINLAGVYYDRAIYILNYYDISKYLDTERLIQKEKLINDLGLPSELIVYLSDVPDTIIMNEVKCDTVKLELSVEKYKGYSAYNVYRAFELILKTNPDIPFVSVEYSGKANSMLPSDTEIQTTTEVITNTNSTTTETTTTAEEATTTTSTTTTTETATSTTETTTAPETTTTVTTNKYFASEDELCNMASEDYKQKTGTTPAKAEVTTNADGTLSIVLTDENGKVLDTYVIDPITGIGTSSDGSEVNLPQTGNNSLKTVTAASAALALALFGSYAVVKSGVLRKKDDEQ